MEDNKVGRPPVFKPEFINLLRDFYTHDYINDTMYLWDDRAKKYMPKKLPALIDFAKRVGVTARSVARWMEKGQKPDAPEDFKKFRQVYENECIPALKAQIVHLGISGIIPPSSYMFTAINFTDMKNKSETDVSSGGKPISLVALHERLESV